MADVVYVALGSNLGERAAYLAMARAAMTLVPHVRLLAASRVEETIPLGPFAQGPYLNQMIAVATTHDPLILLDYLQAIERRMGRVRARRWSARIIDLDIVRFGNRVLASPRLTLPHPGLAQRGFWRREADALTESLGNAA